ncbi:MAG: hypothetical protein ACKN9W_19360 [Methylococcus sp.]
MAGYPVGPTHPANIGGFFCCIRGHHKKRGGETSEILWVDPEEVPTLIALTAHQTGRDRDLAILAAAVNANR